MCANLTCTLSKWKLSKWVPCACSLELLINLAMYPPCLAQRPWNSAFPGKSTQGALRCDLCCGMRVLTSVDLVRFPCYATPSDGCVASRRVASRRVACLSIGLSAPVAPRGYRSPPRQRRTGNLCLSWKRDLSSKLCFPNSKLYLDEFETWTRRIRNLVFRVRNSTVANLGSQGSGSPLSPPRDARPRGRPATQVRSSGMWCLRMNMGFEHSVSLTLKNWRFGDFAPTSWYGWGV